MKIVYLCADPGIPLYGRKGCSTHVRETVHALENLGHQVRVIACNVSGDKRHCKPMDVIHVPPYKSKRLGFDLRHILNDVRFGRVLGELIGSWKPDAIYERYSLYSMAGGRAAKRYDLPRLLEVNAFLTREQSDRIRMGWLARVVEKSIIRNAPGVIVVSEPLAEEVVSLGLRRDQIAKMPMAVNLEHFNPARQGDGIRERYGLDDRFVVGYVGTLTGWHGIRLLYDMIQELIRKKAPPFSFLVVGGSRDKVEMHRSKTREAGLEEYIQFIGSVPYEEVPDHIRAMNAAIVPDTSYWSSPAKLFEYQASGVAVLAPSYPSVRESLDHGIEGYIYEPKDIEQMAEMALRMMRDPEATRQMGLAGRQRAEREHSWEHNGRRILELFQTK